MISRGLPPLRFGEGWGRGFFHSLSLDFLSTANLTGGSARGKEKFHPLLARASPFASFLRNLPEICLTGAQPRPEWQVVWVVQANQKRSRSGNAAISVFEFIDNKGECKGIGPQISYGLSAQPEPRLAQE